MGIKCADNPFNMGIFFHQRVHFQTLNTYIQAFHNGVAPLGRSSTKGLLMVPTRMDGYRNDFPHRGEVRGVGRHVQIRGDVKIPHSRMTKTCWETLVTCL